MNSRRKVSAALLGMLALVVGVWCQGAWSAEQHPPKQNHSADFFVTVDPDR